MSLGNPVYCIIRADVTRTPAIALHSRCIIRKIILYTAVSLDGLIARKNGSVDWLDEVGKAPEGGDYGYADFIAGVDATIMGHETYRVAKKLDGFSSMAGFTNYVITRTKDRPPEEYVTWVSGDPVAILREKRKGPGGTIWLMGGGQINSLLASAGMIDEMVLTSIPIVLGEGIPLFAQPSRQANFSLTSSRSFSNGLVQSVYTLSPQRP